jgi:hypothetical protein
MFNIGNNAMRCNSYNFNNRYNKSSNRSNLNNNRNSYSIDDSEMSSNNIPYEGYGIIPYIDEDDPIILSLFLY